MKQKFCYFLHTTVDVGYFSDIPTQSLSHPVLQHFKLLGQLLSSVQKWSTSSGHSAGGSKAGHLPGPVKRCEESIN